MTNCYDFSPFNQDDLHNVISILATAKYYDPETKFILIAADMKATVKPFDLKQLFSYLFEVSQIANVLIIGDVNGSLMGVSYNPFQNKSYTVDTSMENVDITFPDKLKNLHGYKYTVIFRGNKGTRGSNRIRMGSITTKDGTFGILFGPDILFLETVVNKQNAGVRLMRVESFQVAALAINRKEVDMVLDTDLVEISPQTSRSSINTFETDGFCAMVPMPEIRSYFDFILKPFDLWTWIFVFITITSCTIAWKLLNLTSNIEGNSSSYYVFGFIANFLGQSVPFREHRTSQKIILQLTIVLTFILGTLYQSLIISSITASPARTKITKIDELIIGDYSFQIDKSFVLLLNNSECVQRMSPKIVGNADLSVDIKKVKQLSSQKIAIIATCSTIDFFLNENHDDGSKPKERMKYYYMLDEPFNSFYMKLLTSPYSWFHKRFQEFSLVVFESGIKKASTETNPVKDPQKFEETNVYKSADYFLVLNDIAPVFYILGFGLALSTFVLLMEIFWHDFLEHLRFDKITAMLKNSRNRLASSRRFRVAQVVPINRRETSV